MTETTLRATESEASSGLLVTASAMPYMSPNAVAAVIGSFELAFTAAHAALTRPVDPDPHHTGRRRGRPDRREVRAAAPTLRVVGVAYRNPTEMSVLASVGSEVAKQTVSLLEFICNWRDKRRLLEAQADRAEADAEFARLEVEARRREVYGLTRFRTLPVSIEHLEANDAALRRAQPALPPKELLLRWSRGTTEAAVRAGVRPGAAQVAFSQVDVLHAIELLTATGLMVKVVSPKDASAWEPPR